MAVYICVYSLDANVFSSFWDTLHVGWPTVYALSTSVTTSIALVHNIGPSSVGLITGLEKVSTLYNRPNRSTLQRRVVGMSSSSSTTVGSMPVGV